jgi:hypothetical protein
MPNVLIRDVPGDDLEQLRSAAADRGLSLQAFLREAVHAQAAHLRRRQALARTALRLHGQAAVADGERLAVLDAMDEAHVERAEELTDRSS